MQQCKICGEWIDWDNPNIHVGGHTCNPEKTKKYEEEKKTNFVLNAIENWMDKINTYTTPLLQDAPPYFRLHLPQHYCLFSSK